MDMISNGQAQGNVAVALMRHNMDPGMLRPWIGADGNDYVSIVENGSPVVKMLSNATATLRKDAWKLLDTAIVKAAKPRLKAVADLLGMGLTFNIPNGMAKTVLETETQSDISEAEISMEGSRQSTADRPIYELTNLPLPIIHKDFTFSSRQVMVSQNSGSPLDTSTAELAGRRVAEEAEKLLLGTVASYEYGGGTIYGYTTFPSRLTTTMTAPTAVGWTAATTVTEVLGMRTQAAAAFHYGPYKVYVSTAWDQYLDADYSAAKGDNTLRDRLKAIENISDVQTLDYLDTAGTSFIMLLVQMTSDVVREVVGMNITTVQWESHGGFELNYKVLAIMVPQLRADQNGNTGIVHGTTV